MNYPRLYTGNQFLCGARELVRRREQEFLNELQPLVRSRSVRLDLSSTERVDAAGLAALVSLYCDARKAGHQFTVFNPSRHVARILAIVGLYRVLVSEGSAETVPPGPHMDMVAA